jgi:fructose-1-phosphate kinase PfkB-like protein
VILSGSLPRGVPVPGYAQIIRMANQWRIPVLLDCDGPALAAAVAAKPFLVKPNEHELEQWAKVAGQSASLQTNSNLMSKITGSWVLVTRGAKPALLVNAHADQELTAKPPLVQPRNTVGAGDAMLAAVAQQVIREALPEEWLRAGLAAGSKATQLQAGRLPA